ALWHRRVSLLVAGAFVAFLAMQAPHLVHHFFEPEHVKDECPFAANGERTGGLETEPIALVALAAVSTPRLTPAPLAPPRPRAPPRALLAPPSAAPAAPRGPPPPAPTS